MSEISVIVRHISFMLQPRTELTPESHLRFFNRSFWEILDLLASFASLKMRTTEVETIRFVRVVALLRLIFNFVQDLPRPFY